MLPRKKATITNEAMVAALAGIASVVTKSQLDNAIDAAISEITRLTRNKRVAYGWSGGKDSLPLKKVCDEAGIEKCVLAITDMEYKGFLAWVTDNMPYGLEVINTGQDLRWLKENPDMLYPQNSATAAKWFKLVQHTAQTRFFYGERLDMLLLGRRVCDGNFVGEGGVYTNKAGVVRYSPLRHWTHEMVLAFMHYYVVDIPPIYGYPRGFQVGTGSWAARQWTGGELRNRP